MGIFSNIKNAISGKDEAGKPDAHRAATTGFGRKSAAPVSEVDVGAALDSKHGAHKLNWRTSIIDLMKLVRLDPGYENQKELATKLADNDYSDKAKESIWLHK